MDISPIIIAGSGRSGTTWVLDCLAESNNLSTLFEPLHPIGVPTAKSFAFRYIREMDFEPDLKQFMKKLFDCHLKSIWTKYRIRPDRIQPWSPYSMRIKAEIGLFNYCYHLLLQYNRFFHYFKKYNSFSKRKGIIVKFTRANLMLGWIEKNFNAKIVLLVRHPAAVISSRLRLISQSTFSDWDFEHIFLKYKNDLQLYGDYLHRYADLLSQPLSIVSKLTVGWYIENVLAIIEAQKSDRCVIYYEDLITNPKPSWEKIARALELNNLPDNKAIEKPSQQASIDAMRGLTKLNQITKWQKDLTKSQLTELKEVLNRFNVTIYDIHDPMPINRIQSDEHFR